MTKLFEKYPVSTFIAMLIVGVLLAAWLISMLPDSRPKRMAGQSPASGGVIPPDSKCQCYCSDKCGPRDIKHGVDRPFVDQETGMCFCADRDKLNYNPNGCGHKSFANSCCG